MRDALNSIVEELEKEETTSSKKRRNLKDQRIKEYEEALITGSWRKPKHLKLKKAS